MSATGQQDSGEHHGSRAEVDRSGSTMKRATVRQLIERYFYQLREGCGNPNCDNRYCASSGKVQDQTPDQAAALAIRLFSHGAKLCDGTRSNKVARTILKPGPAPLNDNCSDEGIASDPSADLTTLPTDTLIALTSIGNTDESRIDTSLDASEHTHDCEMLTNAHKASSTTSLQGIDTNATVQTELTADLFSLLNIQSDVRITNKQEHDSASVRSGCSDDNFVKVLDRYKIQMFPFGDSTRVPGAKSIRKNKAQNAKKSSRITRKKKKPRKQVPYLTEEKLLAIIDRCEAENSYALLIRTLGEVFSSGKSLTLSFLKSRENDCQKADMDKEAVRSLQEEDKDEDTSSPNYRKCSDSDETTVDIASVRRAFGALFSRPAEVFESALDNALVNVAGNIELDLRVFRGVPLYSLDDLVNVFLIVFEIPTLGTSEYLELAFEKLCSALSCTPYPAQAKLARIWAKHCKTRLPELLLALQELILVKAIGGAFTRDYCVQDSHAVTAPTKVMRILYYASMLAGKLDEPEFIVQEGEFDNNDLRGNSTRPSDDVWLMTQDPLALELRITALDARKPLIPLTDFYNELLSEAIEMDKDFAYYKSEERTKFSFMNYPFILTPATKALGLYYDNRIRMYSERRMSILQSVVGQPTNPYLRLKVRRDRLIDDALVELDMITMENPSDLKKQLVVEFEGEQGVDEGGVSKEFFQLIVEEIFNPDYGMFTTQEETQMTWFNSTSFESDARFTLIGIVLGLAIYNNVILDVRFSMVVYRKLLGRKGCFADLEDWSPCLYRTLRELLDYTGDDMPETFMQTFRIAYKDVFGSISFHDLKPNGDEIYVTQQNKKEFVDLYADFLLNKSVERQFNAFRRGFKMVTEESTLVLLFRPEEIEELICGSKVFDFAELEATTEYSGYTVNSNVIRNFWRVAHSLPPESQRKLLQFTTGSDRVPVGGLSRLKMVIGKYGPDSDRLPIAHTCFNFLLLPDYSTIEKLQDRLLKAINYSKGFGML